MNTASSETKSSIKHQARENDLANSYQEWKRCITVDCGIKLTREYIEQRLRALRDERDEHTIQFTRLYGKAHLNNVINWFERALGEV